MAAHQQEDRPESTQKGKKTVPAPGTLPGRRDGGRRLLYFVRRDLDVLLQILQIDDLPLTASVVNEPGLLVPDEEADLATIRHVLDLVLAFLIRDGGERVRQNPGGARHPAVDVAGDVDWPVGEVVGAELGRRRQV